jgi:hypothetical protein
MGRIRAKTGRHRRSFDRFARASRKANENSDRDVLDDELTTLRGLADQLDRLEADPDASAHTFALVSRTYADLRREITTRLPAGTLADPLADAYAAAIRNSTAT